MKKINLINLDKSDIKYELITFPDGEPHIKLDEIDRKDEYEVICRITNPNELFVLMQVADILDRQAVRWELYITYLMSQRMDRVITFNEAFSLTLVVNTIKGFNCYAAYVFEPHSDKIYDISLNGKSSPHIVEWQKDFEYLFKDKLVCYPDHGAYLRYTDPEYHSDSDSIILNKKRDLENKGKILSIEFEHVPDLDSKSVGTIIVTDDLCDAGGTFIGAAKILREKYPNAKLEIFVRHMVNPKGIVNLSENYDEVYFTNSYKDWADIPDNCHLIEIV